MKNIFRKLIMAFISVCLLASCVSLQSLKISDFEGSWSGKSCTITAGESAVCDHNVYFIFDSNGYYTCELSELYDPEQKTSYTGQAEIVKGKLKIGEPYNDTFDVLGTVSEGSFDLQGKKYMITWLSRK